MTVVDINQRSRRVMIQQTLWALVNAEQVRSDPEQILKIAGRLGEVSDAHRYAHRDIDDELLLLAASVLALVERHQAEKAA